MDDVGELMNCNASESNNVWSFHQLRNDQTWSAMYERTTLSREHTPRFIDASCVDVKLSPIRLVHGSLARSWARGYRGVFGGKCEIDGDDRRNLTIDGWLSNVW